MAYRDDLIALGANHVWPCDGNLNDIVGTLNFVNSGGVFTGPALCEDVSTSYTTNGTNDSGLAASDASVQDVTVDYCYSIWFRTTAIQQPPCRVFGDGGQTANNSFFMGIGNSVVAEADCDPEVIQVGSDVAIVPNRPYNLVLVFRDIGGGTSELEFFIDGVSKGTQDVLDVSNAGRGGFRIGGITGTASYSIGGTNFQLVSPVNGNYNFVSTYVGPDVPSAAEIRNTIFEKGASPGITIASDTEANMQAALNTIASTLRPNEALNIRVEELTGGGDLTLVADNVTHDPLASIHIQYMGTDTLTWVNDNGSDASLGSAPNLGQINFVTNVTVALTVLSASDFTPISGARIFLTDSGGEIFNDLTDVNGQISFSYGYSAPEGISGRARKGTTSPYFVSTDIVGTIEQSGFDATILMLSDE